MPPVLTSAYCAPIEYYAAIASGMTLSGDRVVPSVVYLEACENYQKQSWRNRCRIYSASGTEDLHFPIIHRDGTHNGIPITEVEIDYAVDWVHQHKNAIISAYRTSAFFDYYKDDFFAILDSRPKRLWDLNLKLLEFFLGKLGIAAEIRSTDDFTGRAMDIHPKHPNSILDELGIGKREYFQVFSPKSGFKGGLSIMDLLFNEGPEAITYLRP